MALFGGDLPELSIKLERPDGVYYAGETVRAHVTVVAEDGAKFKEIRAGLLLEEKYQTVERRRDGDGDTSYSNVWRTDEQWAAREELAAGSLPVGFRQGFDYAWLLPDAALPSCQGKIVAARWLVKATVDRKLARDVNAEAPLYVVVPPPARPAPAGAAETEDGAPDVASMRFQLPRAAFVQGETVTGRLVVEPRQDLSPRAVQVSLVRREVVPGGSRTNVEDVVEARQEYPARLVAGQPAYFDFTFGVPAKWSPTYESTHARVEWRVLATLDLPWKRDVHAWQVLRVYNGAPRVARPARTADAERSSAVEQSARPASAAAPEERVPKFCRNCGKPLASGAVFCGNCGAQVARPDDES